MITQRQKRKVREFAYRFEDDAYVAPDMTLLAEHYTEATDGAIIGRRGVINYNNEDAGMPRSGQNKAFIINPNKEYGALYGKFMFHKAGKKLSELMDKAGVHYLIQSI